MSVKDIPRICVSFDIWMSCSAFYQDCSTRSYLEREDFFFHFFFHCRYFTCPILCFWNPKKERGRVPAPSFVGGTGRDHGLRQGERFLVEIAGEILEPYMWATFLKKANYNIGDVNDGL